MSETTLSQPAAAGAAEAGPSRTTLLVYFAALVAMFMATLDMQIVATALPTIAGELGNVHLFSWVGASYMLATSAVAPFYGKLGDMFGRKNVVLVAIILFLAGSAVCGIAWSMESLIVARVLQGLGGGGLMVSGFAMIGELFAPRERARYQGYASAVFALSSILGPVAGGYITATIGWRWVFLVNLPVGIPVLALILFAMKSRLNATRRRVDYAGGLLLAIATIAIVYWSEYVLNPAGPDLWTYLLPAIGVLALFAFVAAERRAEEPIIPLRLFANSTISLVTATSIIAGMVTLAMLFQFALFLQMITGLGPVQVGLLFLPSSIATMVFSMIAGRIITRTGRYKWLPVVAMAVGVAVMLAFTQVNATTDLWLIAVLMAVFGASMGLQFQVLIVAIQSAAPLQDIGAATGLISQARTVGASLGLALNGAVMTWGLTQQTSSMPTELSSLLPEGLTGLSPSVVTALPEATRAPVLAYYSTGFSATFLWAAALFAVALLLTLLIEDRQIPKRG